MALTPAQQQNVDRARYESGESFASNAARIAMQSEPALVIGLGGSGIDAMLRVKSKVHETFKTDIDPETGVSKSVPDNIRFLAMDTDSRPLTRQEPGNPEPPVKYHYRGMYVEPSEQVFIGSNDFTAYLNNRHNLDPYIKSWLSPTLNPVTNTLHGAGGVRQCSRLLLFKNVNALTGKLFKVIRDLTNAEGGDKDQLLSVYLFAGLSGGTGSGTFLDVAYLTHEAIRQALNNDDVYGKASITAYLFMPDLFQERNRQAYIKYNGYAALKELDYLMGIEKREDRFRQQYSPSITVNSSKPPFSLVHLISGHFFESGAGVRSSYQKAMLIAAENVALWLSREGGNAAQEGALSPKQYASNVNSAIADLETTLTKADKLKTVGYCYGLLGASAKILPVRDIMICLCAKLFQEMQAMYENNNPTEAQVMTALGPTYFALTEEHLVPQLLQGTKKLGDLLNIETVQDMDTAFQSGGSSVLRAFDQRAASNKVVIKNHADDDGYLADIQQRIQDELGKFFKNIAAPLSGEKNPVYGPAFANGLLVGVHGSTSLCMTRYCQMKYDECTQRMQAILDARPTTRSRLNKMLEAAKTSFLKKKALYADYLQAVIKYYQSEQSYALFDQLRQVYDQIHDFLITQNSRIFGVIVDSLQALRNIFAENVEVMGNVDVRRTQEGAVLEWSVMPDLSEVNESIAAMLEEGEISLATNKFYKYIWDNLTKWSAGPETKQFDAFGQVMDFISVEFSDLLSEGLERYIQHEHRQSSEQHQRTFSKYIEEVLAPDMSSRAGIMFHTTVEGRQFLSTFTTAPKRELALVPKRCMQIKEGIDKYGASRTSKKDGTEVESMFSDNNAQISWSKMVYGFPLFHYGLLKEYEQAYEESRQQADYNGTHLYLLTEGGQVDWRDLPALVPIDLDPAYRNEYEVKRIERLTVLYKEALSFGAIRRFGSNNALTLMVSDHNAVSKLLDESRQKLESARLGGNLEAVTALKNQLGSYFTVDVDLPKPQPEINRKLFRGTETDELGLPLRWFLTSYDLVIAAQEECELFGKLRELLGEVTALHGVLQSTADAEKAAAAKLAATMPLFIKALWSETIFFEDGKYWYKPYVDPDDDDDDEEDDDEAGPVSANIELAKRTALPPEFATYREYALYYHTFVQGKVKENIRRRILKDAENRLTAMEDDHYSDEFIPRGKDLRKKLRKPLNSFDLVFDNPTEEEKKLMEFYKKAYAMVDGFVSD